MVLDRARAGGLKYPVKCTSALSEAFVDYV